jgi:fatty acid kinase
VLVVGDHATLKVHVHTNDPERATATFAEHGAISHIDVADMREQVLERAERLAAEPQDRCGVLAVVSSDGMAELFRSVGATPLDGGPTLNPSTYELLAGIHTVAAEEVVVLPNSANVRMAAERAAELSDKAVHVVPSRSQQAGLSAVVALRPDRDAAANAAAMVEALGHVRTGAVTEAARDDAEQRPARFHRGDAVGFIDEEIVAWGEPAETLEAILGEIGRDAELVTLIAGQGAPLDGDAVTALAPAEVEVEYSYGGQPSYWWLIAAE